MSSENPQPSVLGQRAMRIPVGGVIRPGVKVLTGAAAKYQQARELYEQGVAAGQSWGEIEAALKKACGFRQSPLTPKNTPYFHIRRSDFSIPELADRILERYGEDHGDGRQLYRFPVLFPADDWQTNLPHTLRAFSRRGLLYWSAYDPDGTRRCYTFGAVPRDEQGRPLRTFGGRPHVLREDNGGVCTPEKCPEYQAKQCNLAGRLLFYIPGIPGSSAIALPTTSFYGMEQMREQMQMVAFIRGRISGTEGGQPVFYLTKREDEVAMLDPETGEPRRVRQWITHLETNIDVSSLMAAAEPERALAEGEQAAAALLDAPGDADPVPAEAPPAETPTLEDPLAEIRAARQRVYERLGELELAPQAFAAYAAAQWGEAWSTTLVSLEAAEQELAAAAQAPEAYREHIHAHQGGEAE